MSSSRARRSATKTINYAKVQDFSDEDLFEDEEHIPVKAPPAPRRKNNRKVKDPSISVYENDSSYQDSKLVYTEKGYDPTLPPPRERFTFMPEYEDDGTLKIELIVGRRPIDDSADQHETGESDVDVDGNEGDNGNSETPFKDRKRAARASPNKRSKNETEETVHGSVTEYEYLVKYKGRSYLHLDWKTGADLESMNKSAKGLYSRYLKKLEQNIDEDLENPEFDPSFVIPEKIVDEAEQEITIELTDKELVRWEKQRERELAMEALEENEEHENTEQLDEKKENIATVQRNEAEGVDNDTFTADDDWKAEEEIDFKTVPIERLRAIINKDGPYYPIVQGADNPYRDGYITEPPKKPRGSYMFFQTAMRTFFQRKNPQAHTQSELMKTLGDTWTKMSEEEKDVFVQLANEETKEYEKQKELLEKAQKPNGVWQPLRRCAMVLDRISSDAFAEVFLEPVDTRDFPDYEEVIDQPMDLGAVKKKLETKKYLACEQFARDVRKIWNNCKIYNQHGSAIWYVADYMSKLFERIYHAWVLDFRERYIRWVDPRARPWEHSCRIHDGSCGTQDEKMVLCDHCDGMYGMACLEPPLKKVPKQAWHCPDCKPRLKSAKGIRMLSAVTENAARKRAELGDIPKKTVTQTMYLVKWAGLGYEYCTWETKKEISNDKLIAEFHRINKMDSDEADLSLEVIDNFFAEVKHVNVENAGGINSVPLFRTQLYAQSRAFQFLKFGAVLPMNVCQEIGPKSLSKVSNGMSHYLHTVDHYHCSQQKHRDRDVVECLNEVIFRVCRNSASQEAWPHSLLPPPLTGEYDAIIPITSKGLMMNVGEMHGSVSFLGYRQFPGGILCPAEELHLVKNIGDKIVAVDGIATIGMSFQDVIALLRQSGKHKYAYMRFQECKYSVSDQALSSVGPKGRYSSEELQRKLSLDRQLILLQKIADDGVTTKEETEVTNEYASDTESEAGSEGSFLPESDDEDPVDVIPEKFPEAAKREGDKTETNEHVTAGVSDRPCVPLHAIEAECSTRPVSLDFKSESRELKKRESLSRGLTKRAEATRSLAFRLLECDVGYSSDEAGDDDFAYFIDGVDSSYHCMHEVEAATTVKTKELQENHEHSIIPAKQSDFLSQGDRSKLVSSVALCVKPPDEDDFETFPRQPEVDCSKNSKELNSSDKTEHVCKSGKRSSVKVEQISVATGETVHVWTSVEAAAATLQLPLAQLKQVLREEYDEEIGDEVGGYKWSYALTGAKVTAGGSSTKGGGGRKAKEAWLEFRDKLYDPNEPHLYKNNNRLRDYQVDGVNWLASTWYKRQGCILSDEMGLGKTVQIVCYIEHLYRVERIKRPFLVVVPLSTIEHWRREFEGWTNVVCCVYHDRQRIWRDVMREYEWYYEDRPHSPEFLKFDVLVTTYDTLISDFDVISQIPFRVSVVDEAHRLRNQKGKLLECMREVSARGTLQYGFQSRVLMSGTPLQNDLTELWTLLNFIEPFKFPDLESFQAKFGNMANRSEVEALQKLISPYMLRRVKEDVAKDIPAKEETLIDVELTSIQKQYYRAIFEHNLAFLNMGTSRQCAPKLMNIQMELRKVCNHPFLLDGVEHRETDRLYKEFSEKGGFDGKTPEQQQHMLNEHGYVMTSGKMVLLDKLLPKLRQEGHKILIFSQMVKMLDLISEYCDFRGFRHERLDGRVRGTDRQKSIDRFENDKDSFLFLLSTRAGGVGINLTAADICIIFDSDWNPQNDVQAQARCHRIGQTKDVRIYRLITSRSFEQEMFERASRKLGLEQAVLGTFEKDGDDDKPTQQEMEQLLKKGAYALLDDDNDEITREFCADDIESILAKRTRTRVVEGTKTASWLNKQGLVVSKSKFTAESGVILDMDDPLFWQKVMPDFVTPSIMLQKLNDLRDEIEGKPKRGPGRGRKGKKKTSEGDEAEKGLGQEGEKSDGLLEKKSDSTQIQNTSSDDEATVPGKNTKQSLSRKNVKGIHNFMSDLKSMMENILDDNDDEEMKSDEKDTCQKLLLTISAKEKIFNEEQRRLAKVFLKRLEGDRRRRCRTSEQQRFKPTFENDEPVTRIRDELRIVGTKKKKRQKRHAPDDHDIESSKPISGRKRRVAEASLDDVGEDGYLHHSDSENDWSHVGEDDYLAGPKQKDRISRKDSLRRRQWGADDDAATVAGRSWPVFPRHVVKKVLVTLLQHVIAYDESVGGTFSVPVPEDEFPEYYEQIKSPMDYGTMKKKLENGEYRSAQAMQKDFILILKNCRHFNSSTSDIVKEARAQHLMRPKLLREAATEHNLFLAEDGTVLEVFDDDKQTGSKKSEKVKDPTGDALRVKKKRKVHVQVENNLDRAKANEKKKKKKESSTEGTKGDAPKDQSKNSNEVSLDDGDEELEGKERTKATPEMFLNDTNGDFTRKEKKKQKSLLKGVEGSLVKKTKKGMVQDVTIRETKGESLKESETSDAKPKFRIKLKYKAQQEIVQSDSIVVDREKKRIARETKTAAKRKIGQISELIREDETDQETEQDVVSKKVRNALTKKTRARGSVEGNIVKEQIDDVPETSDSDPKQDNKRRSKTTESRLVKVRTRKGFDESAPSRQKSDTKVNSQRKTCSYTDISFWKSRRESLEGSYSDAKKNFTEYGPWSLPEIIGDANFVAVAEKTIDRMCKHDKFSVFAEPVTETEAPGYHEIINQPMDFGTMRKKLKKGKYGLGSKAVALLYQDFLLVFDNCHRYNSDDSDVTKEASRMFGLLPEAFVAACNSVVKSTTK